MKILAIIPARGGSKGLPGKNIRKLGGIPLVARSILSAKSSKLISRIVVSTDDGKISQVAKEYGADVVIRPSEISNDTASSEAALLHVLEDLKSSENYSPDVIVFLQCTSPFIAPEDIDGTIQLIIENHADSAFAAIPFHHFLWENPENPKGINHDAGLRKRRQDLNPQYLEAGSVYVMKTSIFLEERNRFCGKRMFYPQSNASFAVEIDDIHDFHKAEGLLQLFARKKFVNKFKKLPNAVVFDFDGVFTDNKVGVTEDGKEFVICSRSDGMGISQLKKLNIPLLVLSSEENPVVLSRCKKLDLECIYGAKDKLTLLQNWLEKKSITQPIMYVGNDINDIKCLEFADIAVVPHDAHKDVLQCADLILENGGGNGAIRELCDMLVSS